MSTTRPSSAFRKRARCGTVTSSRPSTGNARPPDKETARDSMRDTMIDTHGGGARLPGAVIGLVGAGTGLGVAGLIPTQGRWTVLQSEGGHAAFSPSDERERAILSYCWSRWAHVSSERLVSGPGLSLIHEALAMGAKTGAGAGAQALE